VSTNAGPNTGYKKPPIVEAVIAISFSTPLDLKTIDAFTRKRKKLFPRAEDMLEATVAINTQAAHSDVKKIGCKLTSADGTHVIIITRTQMSTNHLAPYTNWETLYEEAHQHWDVLYNLMNRRNIGCVSARYINRIDIPVDASGKVDLHSYFNAGISLPTYAQVLALDKFHISCSLIHSSEPYRYLLQLMAVPSPLIDHMSFNIDIEVTTTGPVPESENKLWELVNSLRKYKNELFEACITSETRKLFR
jgi:uncharacterized protein (TIGR04255 family)